MKKNGVRGGERWVFFFFFFYQRLVQTSIHLLSNLTRLWIIVPNTHGRFLAPPHVISQVAPVGGCMDQWQEKECGKQELIRNCSNYKDLDIAADIGKRTLEWIGHTVRMGRGWKVRKAFLRVNRREGEEWVDQDWDGWKVMKGDFGQWRTQESFSGGFNKFSSGQRTDKTGIWGR